MSSDEAMSDEPIMEEPGQEMDPSTGAPEPGMRQVLASTGGAAERRRLRKLGMLLLLLLLLGLLGYTAYYFEANRKLPLPRVEDTTKPATPQFLYSITGEGPDVLTKPIGVGVGSNGRVYTVDFQARTVKAFTTAGAFLFKFNAINDGENKKLVDPVHLAVDSRNHVWVTDRTLRGIFEFDAEGVYVRRVEPGSDPDFIWAPLGIHVDSAGTAYVTDIPGVQSHRVIEVDPSGKIKTMFGRAGLAATTMTDPGVFSYPNGITLSPVKEPELFIADSNNRRVQVYTPAGSFKRFIQTQGTPRGIVVDPQNRLYVVDVLSHRIDIFAVNGEHLTTFGENGFGPGQFQYPEDIALDARGRIYISDRENNQIQVWGYPTGEIAGVTTLKPGQVPWACLIPLPLLLVPFLFRRRRFMVTADFVEGMIVAGRVGDMANRRWRWIATEETHQAFVGRVVDGVDLGDLLEPQAYSYSDASALAQKLGITMDRAGILAMAKRVKVFCTEDPELGRLAVLLNIDVYDRQAFGERFLTRSK